MFKALCFNLILSFVIIINIDKNIYIGMLEGDLVPVDEENKGQDIFGGIISLTLAILLLTEFALWIQVGNNKMIRI